MLQQEIGEIYGEILDDIILEISNNPDLFPGKKKRRKRNKIKAAPPPAVAALATGILGQTDLVTLITNAITGFIGPQVLETIRETEAELDLDVPDIDETAAMESLLRRKEEEYAEIPDTFSESVLDALGDAIDEGLSVGETQERLLAVRDDFTMNRAETIAQTELGRSRREAKLVYAEENKDLVEKEWNATFPPVSQGGRTRESHWAMNGERIPVDEPFMVDYSLDGKGSGVVAEDIPGASKDGINCRCGLSIVPKGSKKLKKKFGTTENDGHEHTAELDSNGNGKTSTDQDHFHLIQDYEVLEENDHIHKLVGIPPV